MGAVPACFGGYDINDFDEKLQKENGAGHCVNMDVPQQFNRTLEDF